MRVLHIGKFFPPFAGGMEYFLADLLAALRRLNIEAAALVHGIPSLPWQRDKVITKPEAHVLYAACYGQLLYAPISPDFPSRLNQAIVKYQPDLLHLHMPNTSVFWALLSKTARRLPWLIHWHSDVISSRIDRRLALAYRLYRPLERKVLEHSRAVVVSSPPYLEASDVLRPWQDKCRVIPLGIDPERITEPTPDAKVVALRLWRNTSFRILSIGRLTYYKGHDVLIRAMAEMPDAGLVIVGTGDRRLALEAITDRLGLRDKVVLAGFQAEAVLYALLASCDVVCLPSLERTEAFGLVLLEAMRFGKPVVASDIPGSGVGWVVHRGGHGVLAQPGNVASLAAALRQLAESPRYRQTFSQSGIKALKDTFNIDQVANQMIPLYRSIVCL